MLSTMLCCKGGVIACLIGNQAYKGKLNGGVFLQVTCGDAADLRYRGRNIPLV